MLGVHHTPSRTFRLTENPIPRPEDLDAAFVSRIHALFDAFAAHGVADTRIMIHERRGEPLAYAALAWALGRCPIEATMTTSHGRTYESWEITVGSSQITVFPLEMHLYRLDSDVQSKIEKIRREADARIAKLVSEQEVTHA